MFLSGVDRGNHGGKTVCKVQKVGSPSGEIGCFLSKLWAIPTLPVLNSGNGAYKVGLGWKAGKVPRD